LTEKYKTILVSEYYHDLTTTNGNKTELEIKERTEVVGIYFKRSELSTLNFERRAK